MQPSFVDATDSVELARRPDLVLMLDLDGTLVPFADTPAEAGLDAHVTSLLRGILDAGVRLIVVSGRLQSDLEPLIERLPGAWWVAEHGALRNDGSGWVHLGGAHTELGALTQRLEAISDGTLGARTERKSASVCLHWRRVPQADRAELVDLAEQTIDEWLVSFPEFERLDGVEMIEVRARDQHKGTAVAWARAQHPNAKIIAIGDDVTDEDMFRALGDGDLSIVVGRPGSRVSFARYSVDDVASVHRFLGWLREVRTTRGPAAAMPAHRLHHGDLPAARTALLVISNRTPAAPVNDRRREVGGLVSALAPALRANGGVWLGWSGQQREGTVALQIDRDASPTRACFDLSARQRRLFYSGFCNRSLWPMLHGLPGRVRYEDDEWAEYLATNEVFARLAAELADPRAMVWIHDYHLLLVASALRRRHHRGPIGLFLHVPFPSRDVVETMPWAEQVLEGLLATDLVGFHTDTWVNNFVTAATSICGAVWDGTRLSHRGGATRVRAFPIPIDAASFRLEGTASAPDVDGLRAMLGDRKLVLGVDRLDYSKGIPERLEAFERLLERRPEWRGRVTLVQISVPSRAEVPEYADLRARVEHLVGRINGHFGEADWVPVRYLYRSYGHDVLAQLYRLADVAVVSPLRDGMNLVAKEFVAAQDPTRPGVLVLSRFAGAADQLRDAILTNPFHRDGMASDLEHALAMPAEERRDRHARLQQVVEHTTPSEWAGDFLDALAACRTPDA